MRIIKNDCSSIIPRRGITNSSRSRKTLRIEDYSKQDMRAFGRKYHRNQTDSIFRPNDRFWTCVEIGLPQ